MNVKRLCGDDIFISLLEKKEAEIELSFSENFSHISDLIIENLPMPLDK